MKKYNSIAYTSEIMEDYCDDKEQLNLLKKQYYFFVDKLRESAKKDTTKLNYKITNLGYLYFTLNSCLHLKHNAERTLDIYPEQQEPKVKYFSEFEKNIRQRIFDLKQKGVKNIFFLKKRFSSYNIKNKNDE